MLYPSGVKIVKPGISIAKRRMMARRVPIAVLIAEQEERIAKIDVRIGELMNKRVDAEEVLAELLRFERPVVQS